MHTERRDDMFLFYIFFFLAFPKSIHLDFNIQRTLSLLNVCRTALLIVSFALKFFLKYSTEFKKNFKNVIYIL